MSIEIKTITTTGEIKPEINHIPNERYNSYVQRRTLGRSQNDRGALQAALIHIGGEAAEKALEEHEVLLSRDFMFNQKYGAVFPQIDINGVYRNVKVMAYGTDGHRLKEGERCMVWDRKTQAYVSKTEGARAFLVGKGIMYDYDFKARQCFFGEHLLLKYPDKPIIMVEGEKSAVVCSYEMPGYVTIATGGIYGCRWYSPEVYEVLRGRSVTLIPDVGAEEDWAVKAEILALDGIDVSIFNLEETGCVTAEDRVKGLDIADYFIRLRLQEHPELLQKRPEEPTSIPTIKKAIVPELSATLSKLSPPPPVQPIEESYNIDPNKVAEYDDGAKKKGKQPAQEPIEDLYKGSFEIDISHADD